MAGQTEVVSFLKGALTDAGKDRPVVAQTHISTIVLGGGRAFKLKRAVKFPYLDFTSPALRLAACEKELALNRRTAPELYLAVRRITRADDGGLEWDGKGALADAIVEMRRFDEADLFDNMAQSGRLTPEIMTALAHQIAEFHRIAASDTNVDGVSKMAGIAEGNDSSLRASGLVGDEEADRLRESFQAALHAHGPLLASRARAGKIRRCHGDLYLRNICLSDGRPTLFDCIEFNDSLATIDVLYDLAFLLMDLWRRDLRGLANLVLNRYLDEADETDGLPLLPFFMAARAMVRAHVAAGQISGNGGAKASALRREAQSYLRLSRQLLERRNPMLAAVGGFSGSGKSTVAAALAAEIGPVPGARVLNSDRIRKRIHGTAPGERLPETAYRPEVSDAVYRRMMQEAERIVRLGHGAITDAVFDREIDRQEIARVAASAGVRFLGLWLEAPACLLADRIAARAGGPSDATPDVMRTQVERGCGTMEWPRIAAANGADATIARAKDALRREGNA